MGRNLDNPFIPSDAGSRLGFGFFSNSFMSARSFLGDSAGFASGAPIGGESPHARPQYRGRFLGKSRELALNDRSHPSNSFNVSLAPTRFAMCTAHRVKPPVRGPGSSVSKSRSMPLSLVGAHLLHPRGKFSATSRRVSDA